MLLLDNVILKPNLLLMPQYQAECMMQMFRNIHCMIISEIHVNQFIYVFMYIVVNFLFTSGNFCFSFVLGYGNVR